MCVIFRAKCQLGWPVTSDGGGEMKMPITPNNAPPFFGKWASAKMSIFGQMCHFAFLHFHLPEWGPAKPIFRQNGKVQKCRFWPNWPFLDFHVRISSKGDPVKPFFGKSEKVQKCRFLRNWPFSHSHYPISTERTL